MNSEAQVKRKTGVARLLEIAKEQRPLLILAGVLSVIATLLQFSPYVAVYFIVAELLENAGTPALIDYGYIQQWGIYALLFLVGSLVFTYAGNMSSHVAAFRTLYNMRVNLSQHLARLPMGYFNRQSTGAIKKNLEMSVEKIENFIAHQIPDFVGAIVLPVIMLVVMFVLDWRLALVSLVLIIIAYMLQMRVYFSGKGAKQWQSYLDAQEKMNAEAVEYVRGMPAVKVFGLSVHNFLRFHNSISSYREFTMNITTTYKRPYSVFFVLLSSILTFIVPVAVLLISGQPGNQALALTIMVFLVMAPGLSVPVLKLLYMGGNLKQISAGTERLDQIIAQEPVPEPATPKTPAGGTVSFENVFFSYDDKDAATRTEALSDVSFTASEGKITALVGPSGSGKSTIASLIPRFWDVSSGSIKIGGVDVRETGTEKLMDTVSFVFQDVHLFYDTIEENIRMGNTRAGMEDVVGAAKAACCHEFIARLSEGYQTKIGEGGTYLSGGEAQRVAVARAILKNAPILVLDEATAFADPENEVKIQQGLISLIQGKTVIVIAHRLTTIREADNIVVVDNGRIVETGNHEELLGNGGLYKRMWQAHIDAGAWALASEELIEGVEPR
jgi:ATP-binding cassette, subfamily B, bacterial IrtA/YbtP